MMPFVVVSTLAINWSDPPLAPQIVLSDSLQIDTACISPNLDPTPRLPLLVPFFEYNAAALKTPKY